MSNSICLNGVTYRKGDIKSVSRFYEDAIPEDIECVRAPWMKPYRDITEHFTIPEKIYQESFKTRTHKGGIFSPGYTEVRLNIDNVLLSLSVYQVQRVGDKLRSLMAMGVDVPSEYLTYFPPKRRDIVGGRPTRVSLIENVWRDLHHNYNLTRNGAGEYYATFSPDKKVKVVVNVPGFDPIRMNIKAPPYFEEMNDCIRFIREEGPKFIESWSLDKLMIMSNITLFFVEFYHNETAYVALDHQLPTISDARAMHLECIEALS